MKASAAVLLLCSMLSCGAGLAAAASEPRPVQLAPLSDTRASIAFVGAGQGSKVLTLAEIEALGLYRVRTATFWPGDDGVYEGALLSDVLQAAGLADAKAIRVLALDGFSQVLPRADWTRWPLLLATRRDGMAMSARNKGPFRIIYPRDMSSSLQDPTYRLRWVWLIRSIEAVSE